VKKIMLVIILITVLCLFAGCSAAAAVLMPSLVGNDGAEKVMRANAMNICTAINAYNALNPDDHISEIPSLSELKEKLGEIYPDMSDEEAEKALALIEMKDGEAQVREE